MAAIPAPLLYEPDFVTQTDVPAPWTDCNCCAHCMQIDHYTYGRVKVSHQAMRAASGVPVSQGTNFAHNHRALKALTGYETKYSEENGTGNANISWAYLRDEVLAKGGGAIVCGWYRDLRGAKNSDGQAMDRWQPGSDFGHAVHVCNYNPATGYLDASWRDPLGRGNHVKDRVHINVIWNFIWRNGNGPSARVTASWGFKQPRPAGPPATPPPAPKSDRDSRYDPAPGSFYYTVRAGDTLQEIARGLRNPSWPNGVPDDAAGRWLAYQHLIEAYPENHYLRGDRANKLVPGDKVRVQYEKAPLPAKVAVTSWATPRRFRFASGATITAYRLNAAGTAMELVSTKVWPKGSNAQANGECAAPYNGTVYRFFRVLDGVYAGLFIPAHEVKLDPLPTPEPKPEPKPEPTPVDPDSAAQIAELKAQVADLSKAVSDLRTHLTAAETEAADQKRRADGLAPKAAKYDQAKGALDALLAALK